MIHHSKATQRDKRKEEHFLRNKQGEYKNDLVKARKSNREGEPMKEEGAANVWEHEAVFEPKFRSLGRGRDDTLNLPLGLFRTLSIE